MKRSEMIELMMEDIIHIEDMNDVDKLLTKMENKGMLPPEYSGYTESGHGQRHYSIRKWEPEDKK